MPFKFEIIAQIDTEGHKQHNIEKDGQKRETAKGRKISTEVIDIELRVTNEIADEGKRDQLWLYRGTVLYGRK
ncbi:hypothetical protein SDC9_139459 [bioreactor metagenome]|uniref:Uncharacterized protein n=1 Tax=bioreactor metagenome TaxID=1076179 RepID=A0A645DS70_9ZZZZ